MNRANLWCKAASYAAMKRSIWFLAPVVCLSVACDEDDGMSTDSASANEDTAAMTEGGSGGDSAESSGGEPERPRPMVEDDWLTEFCPATLETEAELWYPSGAGGWSRSSANLPAGSTIYLTRESFSWEGYYLDPPRPPARLDELIPGESFSSDCIPESGTIESARVLLRDSTFYATEDLDGDACLLPAGFSFENGFNFFNGQDAALVESTDLATYCGWRRGYTDDITFTDLVLLSD